VTQRGSGPMGGRAQAGSNWGRWGAEDERGALNLQTPEAVLAATRVCRTGKVYSLSLPIQQEGMPLLPHRGAPMRLATTSKADQATFEAFGARELGANEDVLVIASHNQTHMDALCHVYHRDRLYNGFGVDTVTTSQGASRCGIDKARHVVGRAVHLDLPGYLGVDALEAPHVITGAELEACASSQGVQVRPGDVLLVRTGWIEAYLASPDPARLGMQAGLGLDACEFVRDHDVSAVGADNSAVEAIPFDRGSFLGVHVELLVNLGVPLIEHLVLGQLAADSVHECLFVAAPLPVRGGTGSPVNPVAIA
jgi:kynurenine formamidase